MSVERIEVSLIVNRLLDNLSATISSTTGREGIALRQKIGDLRSSFLDDLNSGLFATKLLACFTSARTANVKLAGLINVHTKLFEEEPVSEVSIGIVQTAVVFCLAAESRMITDIEFTSRDAVQTMINDMKMAFDTARELSADAIDSSSYQTLTFLAGALTNHLANISRPLPRIISFKMTVSMPALSLSNRIYHTAERWEEIVLENKIVHPAFCMREVRGLSS